MIHPCVLHQLQQSPPAKTYCRCQVFAWYSSVHHCVAGKEHELQLRREADAAEPQKLAKRKHQISSLYHASKLKVLNIL